ncbi:hypothetical protein KsCSTR_24270 [Candidatus Kuenenia stuttgartiensis]|jgi:hypothetical protein|uniref:Uncharacterized protein n=1 Tax=Kuenenia stuttgartiensis TaxID=174633 RepID=Q1Q3V6_KUEST|nr:hypothetical protein KsCSTR_24270 [Candidatus Kuenenia stuttgartiensis]CAJ74702.1 unknown protein [Candidatus Kuenenia stuttgartiensis]
MGSLHTALIDMGIPTMTINCGNLQSHTLFCQLRYLLVGVIYQTLKRDTQPHLQEYTQRKTKRKGANLYY